MKKFILATVFILLGCTQLQNIDDRILNNFNSIANQSIDKGINNVQNQDDVDYFYKMVVSNDTIESLYAVSFIRGYWLGYINATVANAHSKMSSKDVEHMKCLLNLNAEMIGNRFEILYKRNTFKVGEFTSIALEKTLLNLCEKQYPVIK